MSETHFCRLTDRGVIALAGEDVRGFLQGLITNDVTKVDALGALYAGLLTPQGKILFDFFVAADGARLLIDCGSAQADDLARRLAFYRLRAKIEIENLSASHGVAAVWGDGAGSTAVSGGIAFADPRAAAMGVRVIAPIETLDALAAGTPASEEAYHRLRIGQGLADTTRDIGSGELFPHECNFDQIGAVDFAKGCYVGQEVVSRTHHRGSARKRMLPVRSASGPVAAGSEIVASGKPAGTVLSSADDLGLALIRLDRAGAALDAGETLSAGDAAIEMLKPDWARFPVPGA